VTENARRIRQARAYLDGIVELQDAASQAVCDALPIHKDMSVLDFCAGGGGKALALAAKGAVVLAHDANAARMQDLPARAARAGTPIQICSDPAKEAPFDLVLCDAPCSGSGTWRRTPEAKWASTPERLAQVQSTQSSILDQAATLIAAGGILAYCTCSVFRCENDMQIAAFLKRNTEFTVLNTQKYLPQRSADGFCLFQLKRKSA